MLYSEADNVSVCSQPRRRRRGAPARPGGRRRQRDRGADPGFL